MGFEILKKQTSIDFVKFRKIAYAISVALILAGLAAFFFRGGIRYGVDFAGGVAIQVQFENVVADEAIKSSLAKNNLPGLVIQQFGDDGKTYLIRFSTPNMAADEIRSTIVQALDSAFSDNKAEIQRMEVVGPKVGSDLRNAALEAMYYAILLITVYISGRFEQRWFIAGGMAFALSLCVYGAGTLGLDMVWRVVMAIAVTIALCWKLKLNFALGAIVSLLHDVLITVGILIIFNKEFDLNIIAALMTLVGYSLNDTIVIYDRIRENLKKQNEKKLDDFATIINSSCNQTLSRTIMTSATTIVAALSLFILGGGVIHDFAFTVLLGVCIGTYSSIFVASPILKMFGDTELYIAPAKRSEEYERPGEHGIV